MIDPIMLLRAARNMPPVNSTIVMLRLFARRQCASMSAYFTNSLTPSSGVGLLASPCGGASPGRAARGSVSRKMACRPAAGTWFFHRFKAINSRTGEGQPDCCPFLIGSGNGRKNAPPCFARRPLALLRRLRLDFGLRYFGFALLCARCSRRPRHSPEALALTWNSLSSSAPRLRARPASGVTMIRRACRRHSCRPHHESPAAPLASVEA